MSYFGDLVSNSELDQLSNFDDTLELDATDTDADT